MVCTRTVPACLRDRLRLEYAGAAEYGNVGDIDEQIEHSHHCQSTHNAQWQCPARANACARVLTPCTPVRIANLLNAHIHHIPSVVRPRTTVRGQHEIRRTRFSTNE